MAVRRSPLGADRRGILAITKRPGRGSTAGAHCEPVGGWNALGSLPPFPPPLVCEHGQLYQWCAECPWMPRRMPKELSGELNRIFGEMCIVREDQENAAANLAAERSGLSAELFKSIGAFIPETDCLRELHAGADILAPSMGMSSSRPTCRLGCRGTSIPGASAMNGRALSRSSGGGHGNRDR